MRVCSAPTIVKEKPTKMTFNKALMGLIHLGCSRRLGLLVVSMNTPGRRYGATYSMSGLVFVLFIVHVWLGLSTIFSCTMTHSIKYCLMLGPIFYKHIWFYSSRPNGFQTSFIDCQHEDKSRLFKFGCTLPKGLLYGRNSRFVGDKSRLFKLNPTNAFQ